MPILTIAHSPVSSSPGILGGAIVFTGTRVPAQTLFDYIDDGFTIDEFLEYFPSVNRQQAEEFLYMVRGAVG
jgi:uncharacterized protein (DUF433 family)